MATKKQENENLPAQKAKSPMDTMRDLLESQAEKFREVAPKHLKVDRMMRLLLAAAGRQPNILKCSAHSILLFGMRCSETGLEPKGPGGVWPIPFQRSVKQPDGSWAKIYELQFIADWRGLVNCAKTAGVIADAYAAVVRQNDYFDYELGLEPKLVHKPTLGDRGEIVAAYCVVQLPDNIKRFTVMDLNDIYAIHNRSKAWQGYLKDNKNECPWNNDEEAMMEKTVTRRAMRPFIGASPRLDTAIQADDDAMQVQLAGQKPEPIEMPREVRVIEEPKSQIPANWTKDMTETYESTYELARQEGADDEAAHNYAVAAAEKING